ncbi:hypothetical protein MJM59_32555, partial [Salmonella enterica subsp. enterica serovar Montevideo]|nr:hypothetical protein [Salmonella enterica subsp. enterica serovar Montevideo]
FWRVRHCCHARCIENQIYLVHCCLGGNPGGPLPGCWARSSILMQQVLGVVDALRHCHSVYIFGVGSSGITALDMKHKLMRIGLR